METPLDVAVAQIFFDEANVTGGVVVNTEHVAEVPQGTLSLRLPGNNEIYIIAGDGELIYLLNPSEETLSRFDQGAK